MEIVNNFEYNLEQRKKFADEKKVTEGSYNDQTVRENTKKKI